MKDAILKGHPLTENELKEVKGGYQQVGKDPENWKYCAHCGHKYNDDDELEKVIYEPLSGLWGRWCLECGGMIKE